jgi:hypothetical protein
MPAVGMSHIGHLSHRFQAGARQRLVGFSVPDKNAQLFMPTKLAEELGAGALVLQPHGLWQHHHLIARILIEDVLLP